MKPSVEQIAFFDRLLDEKAFDQDDVPALREKFSKLDKVSASGWIEKALTLPKREAMSTDQPVAPPF